MVKKVSVNYERGASGYWSSNQGYTVTLKAMSTSEVWKDATPEKTSL